MVARAVQYHLQQLKLLVEFLNFHDVAADLSVEGLLPGQQLISLVVLVGQALRVWDEVGVGWVVGRVGYVIDIGVIIYANQFASWQHRLARGQ